jgi:hypothetical protein
MPAVTQSPQKLTPSAAQALRTLADLVSIQRPFLFFPGLKKTETGVDH